MSNQEQLMNARRRFLASVHQSLQSAAVAASTSAQSAHPGSTTSHSHQQDQHKDEVAFEVRQKSMAIPAWFGADSLDNPVSLYRLSRSWLNGRIETLPAKRHAGYGTENGPHARDLPSPDPQDPSICLPFLPQDSTDVPRSTNVDDLLQSHMHRWRQTRDLWHEYSAVRDRRHYAAIEALNEMHENSVVMEEVFVEEGNNMNYAPY